MWVPPHGAAFPAGVTMVGVTVLMSMLRAAAGSPPGSARLAARRRS